MEIAQLFYDLCGNWIYILIYTYISFHLPKVFHIGKTEEDFVHVPFKGPIEFQMPSIINILRCCQLQIAVYSLIIIDYNDRDDEFKNGWFKSIESKANYRLNGGINYRLTAPREIGKARFLNLFTFSPTKYPSPPSFAISSFSRLPRCAAMLEVLNVFLNSACSETSYTRDLDWAALETAALSLYKISRDKHTYLKSVRIEMISRQGTC